MKDLTKTILNILAKNQNQPASVSSNLIDELDSKLNEKFKNLTNLRAKLFIYENDLSSLPVCKVCGSNVEFNRGFVGFRKYCSTKCANKDKRGKAVTHTLYELDAKEGEEKSFLSDLKRSDGQFDGNKTKRIPNDGIFARWFYQKYPKLKCDDITIALKHYQHGYDSIKTCSNSNCNNQVLDFKRDYCSIQCSNSSQKKIIHTKKSNLKKYDIECNLSDSEFIEKNRQHRIDYFENYRKNNFHEEALDENKVLKLSKTHTLTELSERWNMPYNTVRLVLDRFDCTAKKEKNSTSHHEKQLHEYLTSLNINFNIHDRTLISPYEIDIVIPNLKLGIEYNGSFFHSQSLYRSIDKNKHKNKSDLLFQKDYALLHIFELDWIDDRKREILKSMIRHKVQKSGKSIYARSCKVVNIDPKTTKSFLEKNHIQGSCPSSIRFGLTYNDELVSVLTMGKARYSKNYDYELLRYASKQDVSVVGGFSKLLSKAPKGKVISYANRDYSIGSLYEANGFNKIRITPPNYVYWRYEKKIGYRIYTRYQVQKHKLKSLLGNDFDKNLTEQENMLNNGFSIYWNSGNIVYEKENK